MHIRWSDAGKASARRFMRDDQDGLRAVGLAILALADDPYPANAKCVSGRQEANKRRIFDATRLLKAPAPPDPANPES